MLHWKPFDEMLSCDYSISTVSLIVVECLTKYLPEYSAVPNEKALPRGGNATSDPRPESSTEKVWVGGILLKYSEL